MLVGISPLSQTSDTVLTTTNGDSVVGVMGLVSFTVLAFYMHYQLVVRSMHLITAVPQMVSQIIQATDQERGEHREGTQVFAAIGDITSRGINQTSGGVAAALKPKDKDPTMPTERENTGGGSSGTDGI